MPTKTHTFPEALTEYRKQLQKGTLQKAYKGLMQYFDTLRLHLEKGHPDYFVSGSVQYGFMDYSYFYFFPQALKQQQLKIVILFNHEAFGFEVWLAGYNKIAQAKYLKVFADAKLDNCQVASTTKGTDYILKCPLGADPDFGNLEKLTKQIETETVKFTEDVEKFLSKH